MKHVSYSAVGGILFLIFFFALSIGIQNGLLQQLDVRSMIDIQKHVPQQADAALSLFSLLGSFEITTGLLCIILFVRRKKYEGLIILTFFVLGLTIELFGKNFINYPGPPKQFFRYDLEFSFPTSLYQTGYSYPSGHAFRSAFLSTILISFISRSRKMSHQKKQMTTIFLLGIFLIMILSRVSLGEHWLSDVLAGTALGVGLALLSLTQLVPKHT